MGKTLAIAIWIITALNFYSSTPAGLRYFLAVFPNIGLQLVFQNIFQYERSCKFFKYCIEDSIKCKLFKNKKAKSLDYNNMYVNYFGDKVNIGGLLGKLKICSSFSKVKNIQFVIY